MSRGKSILFYRYGSIQNSRHIWTMINYLSDNGFKVSIVCGESDASPVDGLGTDVRIIGLDMLVRPNGIMAKIKNLFIAGSRLRRVLREESFDLLYVIDSCSLPVLFLATIGTLRCCGRKLVYHTFDWLEPGLVNKIHCRLEKAVCSRADMVVNVDRSRARLQRTLYGLDQTPLSVPNYLSKGEDIPLRDNALREELLGTTDDGDKLLIIYPTTVSNQESSERMTFELISSLCFLPENYHLVIFYREGSEYQRCLKKVNKEGLQNQVRFMEPVPFKTLLAYLSCADLGAIFYDDKRSSGYFMCNADKMSLLVASGVPYIASDYPNLEALTYKYGLGECCDPRQPEKITLAIKTLTASIEFPDKKAHLRKVFDESMSFEAEAGRLVEALSKIMNME